MKLPNLILFLFAASLVLGFFSMLWQFWAAAAFIIYLVSFLYLSNGLRDITDIHAVALTSMMVYLLPATVSIFFGGLEMSGDELLRLYSSIGVGFAGYVTAVLFFRKKFYRQISGSSELSLKINDMFWRLYRYRFVLAAMSGLMIFLFGFAPLSMSYVETVAYRMHTPGAVQYFTSLLGLVFSALGVAMISIVGDVAKRGKLSWMSYLLIALVVLSIIAGNRLWIVSLIGCFLIVFQPSFNRKKMIAIALIGAASFFLFSGAVRYARRGVTFEQNVRNFQSYMMDMKNMNFDQLVWGFSDLTVPFSTFVTIIKNVPDKISYDYLVPLNDISSLIPTVVYPDRPLAYSQWYVKNFEPEVYAIGGGRTFYIIAIGYLFAGPAGAFFYLFLFGALLECVRRFFKTAGGAAGIFMYSYFFVALISLARSSGFASFVKTSVMLYFLIPLALLSAFTAVLDLLIYKKYQK